MLLPENLLEVRHGRTRAKLAQDVVTARRCRVTRHAALAVLQITERDGLGGAGLLACGLDLTVPGKPSLVAGAVTPRDDPLHAHRALLHDPAVADGHVRVQLEVHRRRPLIAVPIEPPHHVRTVVPAVARADAAIVDLRVEPVRRVIGGEHGADRLAGRHLAVLAEHREEARAASAGGGLFRRVRDTHYPRSRVLSSAVPPVPPALHAKPVEAPAVVDV